MTRALRLMLVAALAGLGLVAVTFPPAVAARPPCEATFASAPGAEQIPGDGAPAFSAVRVPVDGLVVTDVDIAVDIEHARPADLAVSVNFETLVGLKTGPFTLFDREGNGAGGGVRGTVFDDEADTPISSGVAPFEGRYRPRQPLAAFDNVPGGSFGLFVSDQADGITGTLHGWSVTLRYQSCDLDADGVEDHADQCRDLTARTATGCPVTSRAVTVKHRAGRFRGALSSPEAGCKAGRAVTVFRMRPGPDRRVGTATTRADGSFRLARAKNRGRYYATSARAVVPDRAECPAVTSRTFRIR